MHEPSDSKQQSASDQPLSPPGSSSQAPATEAPTSLVDLAATSLSGSFMRDPFRKMLEQMDDFASSDALVQNAAEAGAEASSRSDEDAAAAQKAALPVVPGFKLSHEIARGGMGVVFRARDLRLDREVAIKILNLSSEEATARFLAEARITAQLQPPGIPPVHELGYLPDGRPFLAMKLVKGQTLAKLLKNRPTPQTDRSRLLAIFEQICYAVGYAHAHQVIHRDLKPGNVMVGAFGEVQVMDWGLAKVIDPARDFQQPVQDHPPQHLQAKEFAPETTEHDSRVGLGSSLTRVGLALGTPAYMAPEQAAGRVDELDPRTDVFGLGAVLCEMLTGQPPYAGLNRSGEALMQAFFGQTAEAFARLDASGAEPEVIALCKRCLSMDQRDRPADGNAVAQEVARIRQEAEERARETQIERARAEVFAAEQRKRRRIIQWSAAAVVLVLVIGLVTSLWQMQRAWEAERQAAANEAKAVAERDEKERQRQRAEANERKAQEEERRAKQFQTETQAVLDFVQDKIFAAA